MSLYPNTRGTARRSDDKHVRVATHIPALNVACSVIAPTHVVEHGMGYGSTPHFHSIDTVTHILSFENDERWRECNCCIEGSATKHVIIEYSDSNFSEQAKDFPIDKTIALIDGEAKERPRALSISMQLGVPWIVEHDAECFTDDDLKVRLGFCKSLGYTAYQHVALNPESVVYVRGSDRPDALSEVDYVQHVIS